MRGLSRLLMRRDDVLRAAVAPAVELLESRTLLSISLDQGVLSVLGTGGRDNITFSLKSGDSSTLVATCNSQRAEYAVSSITRLQAYGFRGDDSISATGLSIPVAFYGGAGNDTLVGGSGNDILSGDGGNNLLMGNGGNNRLLGGLGNDRIIGGLGNDTIRGGGGEDVINGGGGGGYDFIPSANRAAVNRGGGMFQPLYRSAAVFGATPLPVFSSGVVGLTPTQVRTAYGFGDLSNANFINRGRGQTIYIVDAFTGVDVRGDLDVFSSQFGLPLTNLGNFRIVNANSGGLSPAVDAVWAAEIALDLQWAHAIAPMANLVLVQADTAFPQDMLRAVQLASRMSESSNGGVVSMSFGTVRREAERDPFNLNFETVFKSSPRTTFVAAAGDNPGVSYPASSPNVLSVGGTRLYVDSIGNQIAPEEAWGMTGGGTSGLFAAPTYQSNVSIGNRVGPDVGYNADPDSGVAVYNSTGISQLAGWMPGGVGGTSAGAPQWAALIALANNQRVQTGRITLGGRVNATIYQIAQSSGGQAFNDITTGGPVGQLARAGFDLSTGWGTPRATELIGLLSNTSTPFLSTPIKWKGTMIQSSSATNTNLIIAMGGTGFATGGSRISLSFSPVPNKFDAIALEDVVGLVANITATDLYRSAPDASGVSRVYGDGEVSFSSYRGGGIAVPGGGPLKFDGTVSVDAQGNEHISAKFWAVDQFGNPWPTSPFALGQLNGFFVSFKGSFEG